MVVAGVMVALKSRSRRGSITVDAVNGIDMTKEFDQHFR